MEDPKKKVKRLSIGQKKEIIELIQSKKATSATVSRSFGVSPGAISKILKKRKEILSSGKIFKESSNNRYKVDTSRFSTIENALFVWLVQERSKNNVVTTDIMRMKAMQFYETLKENCGDVFGQFSGSRSWFGRFKKRFGLKFLTFSGENQ
jgi:hypothetical protein